MQFCIYIQIRVNLRNYCSFFYLSFQTHNFLLKKLIKSHQVLCCFQKYSLLFWQFYEKP